MIKITNRIDKEMLSNTIFEGVAVGRAFELLREDNIKFLREMQSELHFKYCRFHAIFHDELKIVRRLEDNSLVYEWHQIDKVMDNLLMVGLKPFIELASMPSEIAKKDSGFKAFEWEMNFSEPDNYDEWEDLNYNFAKHLVDRYGLSEVQTWNFEVWNEPSEEHWKDGMDTYWRLYDYAVRGVKRVDSKLKVGGPSSAGGVYITEIIEHCIKENSPIDFISTHCYPIGECCEYRDNNCPYEPGAYFIERFKEVNAMVKESPMPNLKIHWTEWNTQSEPDLKNLTFTNNPTVDLHFAASCIVRNMLGVKEVCDSAAYWVATDIFEEAGMPNSPFSCTYGLMNIQGIKKASYNAYKLLRKLRGYKMDAEFENQTPICCGMEAFEENDTIRIIGYNNHLIEVENQPIWKEKITVPVLEDDNYFITYIKISEEQGSCYETWKKMGSPHNLTPTQEEILRAKSVMDYDFEILSSKNKTITINMNLKPNEVIYIEIHKKTISVMPRITNEIDLAKWEEFMTLPQKRI